VKSLHFLNQVQLADRWHMSPRTLERWRWLGQPPRFTKIGGKVLYRLGTSRLSRERSSGSTPRVAPGRGRLPSARRMGRMRSSSRDHAPTHSSSEYSHVLLFALYFAKRNIRLTNALVFC
jgi:hypothetical protein